MKIYIRVNTVEPKRLALVMLSCKCSNCIILRDFNDFILAALQDLSKGLWFGTVPNFLPISGSDRKSISECKKQK